jgi:hypothetical protein
MRSTDDLLALEVLYKDEGGACDKFTLQLIWSFLNFAEEEGGLQALEDRLQAAVDKGKASKRWKRALQKSREESARFGIECAR